MGGQPTGRISAVDVVDVNDRRGGGTQVSPAVSWYVREWVLDYFRRNPTATNPQLGAALGVTKQTVGDVRAGVKPAGLKVAVNLAAHIGVPYEQLREDAEAAFRERGPTVEYDEPRGVARDAVGARRDWPHWRAEAERVFGRVYSADVFDEVARMRLSMQGPLDLEGVRKLAEVAQWKLARDAQRAAEVGAAVPKQKGAKR
jgi:DNA-binding XRE family transcriptional regulator